MKNLKMSSKPIKRQAISVIRFEQVLCRHGAFP